MAKDLQPFFVACKLPAACHNRYMVPKNCRTVALRPARPAGAHFEPFRRHSSQSQYDPSLSHRRNNVAKNNFSGCAAVRLYEFLFSSALDSKAYLILRLSENTRVAPKNTPNSPGNTPKSPQILPKYAKNRRSSAPAGTCARTSTPTRRCRTRTSAVSGRRQRR